MLLRPIHIKSKHNSDTKDKGSSLSTSGPEALHGTETSCGKTQSAIKDSTTQKAEQPDQSVLVSQNPTEEFINRPNRNRQSVLSNKESYEKKAIPWKCQQNLFDISLFRNPFFYIFTWSFLLSQLAYFIPTFHLVARAKTLGIDIMDASYLVSVAGKKTHFYFLPKRKSELIFTEVFIKSYWKAKEK